MGGFRTRRALILGAYLVAVTLFTGGVFWFAFTAALDQLDERGRADLSLASDRLTGQLQRYRELAVFLADHPVLVPLTLDRRADPRADAVLVTMADKTSALDIALADGEGRILAASGPGRSPVTGAPYFERAMDGALGAFHGVEAETGQRVFTYAAPVYSTEGPAAGAVIVSADIAALEHNWPSDPAAMFFSDDLGVVFVANRSDLVLSVREPDAPRADRSADYTRVALKPFPGFSEGLVGRHELWSLDGGRYLPARALHLTLPMPVVGMTGEILLDLTPALNLAGLQATVAAGICLAFGAILFWVLERRRQLSDRLALEAATNAELEARVAARTAELSRANAELTREVGERREAEAALTQAQADLVQAGKLSALGQMSAGISHELNQPLMAIRSFAENSEALIARGKTDIAAENLGRISELARRMGRIIKNLRAFARQEPAEVNDVDLVHIVDAALEIVGPSCTRAGVALDWQRPDGVVLVRGGEVRLQQVVMNLVSNAVDAMEDSAEKRVTITLEADGAAARLSVADTGPGIAELDRIFDPFYSTKEVGRSEGMGLGLSISYGLVQSFGGVIRGQNRPGGGAVFTVELPRAARAAAA